MPTPSSPLQRLCLWASILNWPLSSEASRAAEHRVCTCPLAAERHEAPGPLVDPAVSSGWHGGAEPLSRISAWLQAGVGRLKKPSKSSHFSQDLVWVERDGSPPASHSHILKSAEPGFGPPSCCRAGWRCNPTSAWLWLLCTGPWVPRRSKPLGVLGPFQI